MDPSLCACLHHSHSHGFEQTPFFWKLPFILNLFDIYLPLLFFPKSLTLFICSHYFSIFISLVLLPKLICMPCTDNTTKWENILFFASILESTMFLMAPTNKNGTMYDPCVNHQQKWHHVYIILQTTKIKTWKAVHPEKLEFPTLSVDSFQFVKLGFSLTHIF